MNNKKFTLPQIVPYLPLFVLLGIFFLLKATNLGVRLSDTNIYFYTGYQLLQGKILYKDIFFTNFPLLPYVSTVYFLLVGKSLPLFYLTACIEVIFTAIVLFYQTKKQTQDILLATTTSLLYTFSFIVLSTSDHQTGVFLASLLIVLSYYFFVEKKYKAAGIFVAMALLTKAYFLPVFLAYTIYLIIDRRKALLSFLIGFCLTILLLLLPSLLTAPNGLFRDVFLYSLTRSQGISKVDIARFFLLHDVLLFTLLCFDILMIKRNRLFGFFAFFSLLFFLLYKDIYYLYLNFAIPFLCLSFPPFAQMLKKRFKITSLALLCLVTLLSFVNLVMYLQGYRDLQKITNLSQITNRVLFLHPQVLYGQNDIAPALAYLTNTPLLNGIIDTNENIYRKGFLNAKKLTQDAIQQHALLIAHGVEYANVRYDIVSEIFDKTSVEKYCQLQGSFPVKTEGYENAINLLSCAP